MIKEKIAASKYKNPKNRRYSENWLLLCLLFHIRAFGAYKILRNQNLLPLPCITSIRKYETIVKTDCGFDDSFFKLLKKRMFLKIEKQRHGILLFDEVQLRKGLYVNTRNLMYYGLEDMGGTVLAQLVFKAIVLLENSGCLIHGIICDGCINESKMWAKFGISGHIEN
ncbi:THAP-type domain-containing protein [Aphis craccivora]|uniref:THAP-type domain-containing protein n=1 Tax=Aphis craccivora TaxID=307492 RepID=A0A6G0XGA1_APHCR|nr:THAP-type domain-containing protein [Aphis craccivora]